MTYEYKTKPFPHQARWTPLTVDLECFALFWEPGVAKTKVILDQAGMLFDKGKIDTLFALTPKSIAPNWIYDEVPDHLNGEYRAFLWETNKAGNKGYQKQLKPLIAHEGLLVVAMSYDALMTQKKPGAKAGTFKGKEFAQALLRKRRCLLVLDESSTIKSPGAKRTKRVMAARDYAPYRRILDGTPVDNSPFDVYSPLRFLDPAIWDDIGCNTFEAFKTMFGIWVEFERTDNGQRFKKLVSYKNLDKLHAIVDSVGSRLLKSEVLDLPPKLYEKRYFDLSPEQAKHYKDLRRDFMIWLDSGDMVTAPLAITRMLRFQQITSGYLPTDDGDMILTRPNPRIGLLKEIIAGCSTKMIVWAKFHQDVDQIMELLADMEISAVSYDGRTSPKDRETARNSFQKGDVRIFVSNPAAAGKGLTLHAAKTVVYYNTSYKLSHRLQSEDRAHRAGMDDNPVYYIDLIAQGTIDEQIVKVLRTKNELAAIVTGDTLKDWI